MKKLLSIAITALFAVSPAHALFGPADQKYASHGGWDVGFDKNVGKRGLCFAHTSQHDTQVWLSSALAVESRKESWSLALYNPAWKYEDRATYTLQVHIAGKKTYEVPFKATNHAYDKKEFLFSSINIDFANALAVDGKGSAEIFQNNKKNTPVIKLDISRSAAAIGEVIKCRDEQLARGALAHGPTESGTGFYVDKSHVLTAWHVIQGCSEIWVKYPEYKKVEAYIEGTPDENSDLVLLRTKLPPDGIAAFEFVVRLGAPVYTFGFPYAEVLSAAGNFTLGNVTALRGEGNDTRTLQVSAPVQSGNSGGPLLNAKGAVVGILQAKMTLVHDDIAQNANFAIRSALAVNYVNSANITLATISPANAPNLTPEDIAEKAKKFTVQVLCK